MSKCKAAVKEMAAETEGARGRKRKAGIDESDLTTSSDECKTQRLDVVEPDNSGNSACESVMNSDHVSASCCSSNGPESADLEEKEAELIATSVDSRDRRETTPLIEEVHAQTGELESTVRPSRESVTNTSHGISIGPKTPADAELEEFFSAAEKNLQQKFIEKYNYDIVNDEPIAEGRYEWVSIQLKP